MKNLENALQYFLKISMIIVCETSDYNMLKHGHQSFNLAKIYPRNTDF